MVITPSFQVGDVGSIPTIRSTIASLCNGSTSDFGSLSLGSNPKEAS